MPKKKIIKVSRRRKIREKALENMRKARENIPDKLLEGARQDIARSLVSKCGESNDPQKESVAIDKKKNLRVILNFVQNLDPQSDIHGEIIKALQGYSGQRPN